MLMVMNMFIICRKKKKTDDCCEGGEIASGRMSCSHMPWEGYNYEDAILVSEDGN